MAFRHWFARHVVVVAAVQAPAPLQTDAVVPIAFAQLAAVHTVALPGYKHALRNVPSQVPRHVVPAQAARVPRGPPITGTHWPTFPASAQASHWPVQARSQHTPSTQLPLVHSIPVWQTAAAAFFGEQAPDAVQNWPVGHGLVAPHPPEHTEAAQRLLLHCMGVGGVQAPAPLHTVGGVALPAVQVPAAHCVSAAGNVHLVPSVPPQVPLHGACPAHAVRVPRGVPITGVHLPGVVGSLQLSHWPTQLLSQQTPSTQLPLVQSMVDTQTVPLAFLGWQTPVASQ